MTSHPEYYVPSMTASVETGIKKSKFFATITAVTSKEVTAEFFQKVRDEHPGANHNCFAYIIGNPESPRDIGFSDDGEPSGTAGKPMLSILQHNNIGNVAVIVSRFFGGVKLGTGGLVRAYSSSVKMVVEAVPLNKFVQSCRVHISFPFQFESNIRYLLTTLKLAVVDSVYSEDVTIEIEVPLILLDSIQDQITDLTKGGARFSNQSDL